MRKKLIHTILIICISALLFSCDISGFTKNDDAKAVMLSVGMDYQNNEVAPQLSGVINDVYEMSAAFKEVYGRKNVPIDIKYLVQEGYDILVQVRCVAIESELNSIIENVRNYVESLQPVPTNLTGQYDAEEGFVVRFYTDSIESAENIKETLENKYTGKVYVNFSSIINSSSYPSKENIISAINSAKSLRSNDLFIMYYTGHGEIYKTLSDSNLERVLTPYIESGAITQDVYNNALLSLEIKDETSIFNALMTNNVETATVEDIYRKVKTEIDKNSVNKGALITAKTEEEYYGLLDMERLYAILETLECKVILIIDACYSGFASEEGFEGISLSSSLKSFMHSPTLPNVCALSASSPDETSKVTVVRTLEGELQRHSAFTIDVLEGLGWQHSTAKQTYLRVPSFSLNENGEVEETTEIRSVEGFIGSTPSRITADDFFDNIKKDFNEKGNNQTPQRNNSGYLICIIP